MKIAAIVNCASGSVPGDAAFQLTEWLGDRLISEVLELSASVDFAATVQSALDLRPDALLVWAGDGTTALALQLAARSDVPVLALPGGTMNLLHERIYGEVTEAESLLRRCLTEPKVVPLSAARVGDQVFYVGALIGRVTRLTEAREAVRDGRLLDAAQEALQSEALNTASSLSLLVDEGEEERQLVATAAAVFVKDGGELEFGAVDPDDGWDVIMATVQSLSQGWRDAGEVNYVAQARAVTIVSADDELLPVTLDGERFDLTAPITIEAVAEAVRVVR